MKTLYLLRHAKSSWEDSDLDDFHRPLNDRGKRDAPLMAQRLKARGLTIGLLRSSPAERAITTARIIAPALRYDIQDIVPDPALYLADLKTLREVIRTTGEEHSSILLAGHNPGLTDLANDLMEGSVDNLPTCSIMEISLDIPLWKKLRAKCGTVIFFDCPKAGME